MHPQPDRALAQPDPALARTDPGAERTDAMAALVAELIRHARLLHVVRAQLAGWAPAGLDGAAIPLLMQLVKCGPRRQGELAEFAMLDPSTVSRYVGELVRRGLVERRTDPADGRAVQLVATGPGRDAAAALIDRRNVVFREALHDWTELDLRALTTLITRLNDDVDSRRQLFARPAVPDLPAGGAGSIVATPEET
jgi:DNA-binding MarR family transcriptional regulator